MGRKARPELFNPQMANRVAQTIKHFYDIILAYPNLKIHRGGGRR